MTVPRLIACLALTGLAVSSTSAQVDVLPFPLRVLSQDGPAGLNLEPVPELVADLPSLRSLTLVDVPLPGLDPVELQLQRMDISPGGAVVKVDGELEGLDPALALSLWSGEVVGHVSSNVFLAFSQAGTHGWIDTGDQLVHLIGHAPENDWSRSQVMMISESRLAELGMTPEVGCEASAVHHPDQPVLPLVPRVSDGGAAWAGGPPLPYYDARIAVETDYQFYQVFGDLGAAQTYAFALFGAVSGRYRAQMGAIFTMPYVAFYTQNNDPWLLQDQGFGSIDVLYDFVDQWDNGAAPVPADIYTMFSGANLGGGVAYLDVLCNPDFGFSVSGNLHGQSPLPIIPNHPLNWDVMVTAHEFGHNFASPHTHDYCPPLDECYPGNCTGGGGCINFGTLMSYCHLCTGGYENITTFFHPVAADVMRTAVENSCMPLYAGLTFVDDLGASLAGSSGTPSLDVTYVAGTLTLAMSNFTAAANGTLYLSLNELNAPFKGGTLVPFPDIAVTFNVPGSGNVDLAGSVSGIGAGVTLVAQGWVKESGGPFAASNGVRFELIAP